MSSRFFQGENKIPENKQTGLESVEWSFDPKVSFFGLAIKEKKKALAQIKIISKTVFWPALMQMAATVYQSFDTWQLLVFTSCQGHSRMPWEKF